MNNTRMGRAFFASAVAALLSIGAARAQEKKTITFEVVLPSKATLEIDGYKTVSKGESRLFETPVVPVGKTYIYRIVAIDGDKKVAKTITLKTEGSLVFDLRSDFKATKPMPKDENPLKPGLKKGPDKPGFVTFIDDGRLWIFRDGSKDVAAFLKDGELGKYIIRPGIGPRGMTVKGPDHETVVEFLLWQDGFITILEKGGERVWIFKKGSKEYDAFKKDGELAKHVVKVKAGPMGMTVKAPDAETFDAYMKKFNE